MATSSAAKSPSELSEEFMLEFNKKRDELSDKIGNLTTKEASISDSLTNLSTEIQKLSKSLHDAVMFLPSYSVKIRQNEIRDLEKRLKDKEDELVPKKKFGFKSRIAPPPAPADKSSSKIQTPLNKHSTQTTSSGKDDNFLTIEKRHNTTVQFGEMDLNGNDVLVKDCENSVLILVGGPSTLRLSNMKNCKLLCGPVRTSIFIDQVHESVLFLCCQQLRTHSSENLDIYLRVASRGIIEDCKHIRFGPYKWEHEKSEELHMKAEIKVDLERFNAVDDFNWLSSTPSPNWSVIPLEERIDFEFG